MRTDINEIAPDIFRLTTFVPEVAAPAGFSFNQFLIRDEHPFLFHTGMRSLFPLVSEAVSALIDPSDLRWISFSHVEADECGAMNCFLSLAPRSQVVHGGLAVALSLNDMSDRPPVAMDDGQVLELGSHRMRFLPTPHVPHNWESGLWYEETTSTMFVSDLFGQTGRTAPITSDDVVERALEAEAGFRSIAPSPYLGTALDALAAVAPSTLAVMHGASFQGDTASAFADLKVGLLPRAVRA
jgi:flavorubredoxin